MSTHTATINWQSESDDFAYESYTRNHTWRFDNDLVVSATAAPDFKGDPANIDPEEAFVASIASCHCTALAELSASLTDRGSAGPAASHAV